MSKTDASLDSVGRAQDLFEIRVDTSGVPLAPANKRQKLASRSVTTLAELIALAGSSNSDFVLVQCVRALRRLTRRDPSFKRRIGLQGERRRS